MKNKLPIIISMVVFVIILAVSIFLFINMKGNNPKTVSLLRVCPTHWYVNAMPDPSRPEGQPYPEIFQVDGKNIDIDTVDLAWVRKNCEITQPEVVQ